MRFAVYPKRIEIELADTSIQAIETSLSGETMIVHAPGLQFAAMNGTDFLQTEEFARGFVEMSPGRWIRVLAISSIARFGDDFVRVMLADVRQPFDLFPGEDSLKRVYKEFSRKIPRAPSFLSLDVGA